MANSSNNRNETFHPMYFYDGVPLFTRRHVKHMFDTMKEDNETLLVEFRSDPLSLKVKVRETYDNFVLLEKRVVTYGESIWVPYTITYTDVISQEVHILGKKGSLKPWTTSVMLPEQRTLTGLTAN